MTPGWHWGGSRWWRCDLHAHTPASTDYGKGAQQARLRERTPRTWLLDQMAAGLDCVAVTDHNSGAWIDRLKEALAALQEEQPEGFRPLHLFPGVEISVNGGIHLLALFGPEKSGPDVDTLLGAVAYEGGKGSGDGVTAKTFSEVAAMIARHGGIAIPAHVDRDRGLLKETHGETLRQALRSEDVVAMELCDATFAMPHLYHDERPRWTAILGSDAHHPSGHGAAHCAGSHFTWIKMGSPSIEGLRLALLDGALSVRRSDAGDTDPNEHGALVLESIEVGDAHYMGQAVPFRIRFNPWLNAIVGGRGTGKSTIVEFARLALRRETDLAEALHDDFRKYTSVYPTDRAGLLRPETEIRLVYRKNGSSFRVQWSPAGDLDAIEEYSGGGWSRAEGDVRSRFPVRLFSQKEIFYLASQPRALLNVVDEAPKVDQRSWRDRTHEIEARFLSLRAKARELEGGLAEEERLRGELDDVERKLAVFEDAGHADVLRTFQRRSRQQRAVEAWEEGWADAGERLRRLAQDIVPEGLDSGGFDLDSATDVELHRLADAARGEVDGLKNEVGALAARADAIRDAWRKARDASSWMEAVVEADAAYIQLRERLSEEGAGDPTMYGELVQRRQTIEQRLREMEGRRRQVADLREQATDNLDRLLEVRRGMTQSRRSFLEAVLEGNPFVRIAVKPYEGRVTVVGEFRALIQKEGEAFEKDIGLPEGGGLLGSLYEDAAGETGATDDDAAMRVERALKAIKSRVRDIADGNFDPNTLGDQRFANHIGKLPPEALDRLDLWFPEDSLRVEYSPTGDGRAFRPLEEGSPGQKTAALLAFLLSYGDEPLILDQPEDDLDNHLIYELIVTQLREIKHRRQVIVVTHNPNIVVNGDAELVVALAARGGETQKDCDGSLQEREVRDTICGVMEGGREAFEQRYRRIALEPRRV